MVYLLDEVKVPLEEVGRLIQILPFTEGNGLLMGRPQILYDEIVLCIDRKLMKNQRKTNKVLHMHENFTKAKIIFSTCSC